MPRTVQGILEPCVNIGLTPFSKESPGVVKRSSLPGTGDADQIRLTPELGRG